MDAIDIPASEAVPLDSLSSGVHGMRILFVNVFAVETAGGWTLVDAGLAGSAGHIRRWAARHFGDAPPQGIVLTHGHFDHVGAIDALLATWDVPVFVHPD